MEKKKDKERKENNVFAQIAVNLICKFSKVNICHVFINILWAEFRGVKI